MDKLFERSLTSADKEPASGAKRENVKPSPVDNPKAPQSPKHKRQKLSENLQNGDKPSHLDQTEHSGVRDAPIRRDLFKSDKSPDILSHAHPEPENPDDAVTIPVRTFRGPNLTNRETRSQTKQQDCTSEKYAP